MSKEIIPHDQNSNEKEMSFLDHLEELRWHILRSVAAVLVFAIICFIFKDFVFGLILGPGQEWFPTYKFLCNISDITCMTPPKFEVRPIWEVWRFIKPGLYKHEQKAARGIVAACSFLFLCGVMFGYFVIAPFAISFLMGYQVSPDVYTSPTLASFINYMTMLTIPTGIIFLLPVVIFFLAKVGLITSDFMKKYRRHAFVLVFIMAAVITPPDVLTQILIGIPIYILYELSIHLAKRMEKQRAKEEAEVA